jgi:hypothetical protein
VRGGYFLPLAPEITEIGADARDSRWNRVAEQLEQARLLLPAENRLLTPSGRTVDADLLAAHESMKGLPRRIGAVSLDSMSALEQMLQHVYGATRNALHIALTMRGAEALDGRNEFRTEPLPTEQQALLQVLNRELELIHQYSELLGMADPAAQLLEIHSIARDTCALPGTDPVLKHANAMASGHNLDFDIDDAVWDVTRIPRFLDDTRGTALQMAKAPDSPVLPVADGERRYTPRTAK